MLRAAYFGQELLSTFGTSIGEIALIPATGGLFQVHLTYQHAASAKPQEVLLWDRKAEGGFPETKVLKQRVRNHIEPDKNLGHSDTPSKKTSDERSTQDRFLVANETASGKSGQESNGISMTSSAGPATDDCEDCK